MKYVFSFFLLLLIGSADAAPLRGGAVPAGDNIQALLATMTSSPPQIVQITTPLTLTNPLTNSDTLARTLANFDGSASGNSTFGSNSGVVQTVGNPGSSGSSQQMSFSRVFCDISRITTVPCVWWGGGHQDFGDGSIYTANVNTAAGNVLLYGMPLAHTIAVNSCKYVPATVTANTVPGQGVTLATATVTTGGTYTAGSSIAFNSATPNTSFDARGTPPWVGGTGIPDYTTVTSGGGTTSITLSNTVTLTTNETVSFTSELWCTPNAAGQNMQLIRHTYNCNAILQGSNTVVFGGGFSWGNVSANSPGGSIFSYDMKAGTVTVGGGEMCVSEGGNGIINLAPDYSDGNWYTFILPFSGEFQRCTNANPPVCTNIVTLNSALAAAYSESIVVDPSPALGSGHQAYFSDSAQNTQDFFYIDDISNSPTCGTQQSGIPFPPCYGAYINKSLFLCANNPTLRAYTNDASHIIVWDNCGGSSSQLLAIAITPSVNGSQVMGTVTVEASTSVMAPIQVASGNCINIYDLGAKYGHAKLFDNCGALFLGKGL